MMSKHDEKPQRVDGPQPEIDAEVRRLRSLPYAQAIEPLKSLVQGSVVQSSLAGHSGFVLNLEDETWVACYLAGRVVRWKHGRGQPAAEDLALIESPDCGDARQAIPEDRPYATEPCDIRAQVAQAHGQPITGVAIGEDSFNLCFPGGRELDTTVVTAADGRPGLRVFWEQW